jgi:hypothetical protein
LQMLNHALAIPRLVNGDSRIGVRHAKAQGLVEQYRQLLALTLIRNPSDRSPRILPVTK